MILLVTLAVPMDGSLAMRSWRAHRPIDNFAPEDAMLPRYPAEKSGLW
jgi:hypothetical protein